MIILFAGLPATGKSTLAKQVAKSIKGVVLRTDKIRKQLLEEPKYTEEEKKLIYNVTFLIAEYLASAGVNVILDGTFYKRELRHRVYEIARKTGAKLYIIECCAPERIIKERMDRRKRRASLSDADFEVYRKIAEQFEPIRREHIVVDTSHDLKENLREILSRIKTAQHKHWRD